MAKAVLEAGKHVLLREAAGHELEGDRRAGGPGRRPTRSRRPAVNYNLRFYPLNLEARERVRGGEVGKVFHVAGSYVQDWLLLDTDYNWRVLAEEGGELRAVADIGTHWLDLVHAITGLEAESVCADLMVVHPVRKRPKGEIETYSGKLASEADVEPVDITTEDYGSILHPLQGRGPGHPLGLPGHRGPEELPALRARRREGAPSSGSARTPRSCGSASGAGPNQILMRDPSLLSPDRPRRGGRSRRPRRGLRRHLQAALPGVLRLHREGRLLGPAPLRHLPGRAPRGRAVRGGPREQPEGRLGRREGG